MAHAGRAGRSPSSLRLFLMLLRLYSPTISAGVALGHPSLLRQAGETRGVPGSV